MARFTQRRRHIQSDHPGQLLIDWVGPRAPQPDTPPLSAAGAPPAEAVSLQAKRTEAPPDPPLVQRTTWDFRTSFPQPTPEAIDAGVISDEDLTPDNIAALHDEHAREALTLLHDLDAVLDARRRGVDPRTGKPPRTHAAREKLRRLLQDEPARLERSFENLMAVYEEAFGPQAADAFAKAIRARHAGVEVVADGQLPAAAPAGRQSARRRIPAVLPVPTPLPAAVAAGRFGHDDDGRPIRPGPDEVRAITEQHAEKIINLLDGLSQVEEWLRSPQCSDQARLYRERDQLEARIQSLIKMYADDFGRDAADQLDAYTRRRVKESDSTPGPQRG